ncbi:MAG TPA: hypothetical protein VK662_10310 [Acidothermaceae bacterium]|jgi:hypothetical protein|nr:hypothetical protein [Acidothermaceae bacterium]
MYEWIWRKLPGGLAAKLGGCVALFAGVLALLFFVIFPWVEPRLPWNDVTVNSPSIEQTVPSSSAVPSPLPGSPSVLPAG